MFIVLIVGYELKAERERVLMQQLTRMFGRRMEIRVQPSAPPTTNLDQFYNLANILEADVLLFSGNADRRLLEKLMDESHPDWRPVYQLTFSGIKRLEPRHSYEAVPT